VIAVPPGWTIQHLPEAIALTHPNGKEAAQIHYRERAGKPRRVGTLAREILAAWPRITVKSIAPLERLLTIEGEFAALLGVECTEGGRDVRIDLGFVFTDDFFSSTAGTCRDPALRQDVTTIVRELVRHDNLALGVRRRRVEYQPPKDWQPFRRSLATEWIPPDFPRHDTTLLAYPANPIAVTGRLTFGSAHTYLEGLGWQVVEASAIEKGMTKRGVAFEAQEWVFARAKQPPRKTRMVVLADTLYQYPFELRMVATDNPVADRDVLANVVESVVPFGPVNTSATQFWIE